MVFTTADLLELTALVADCWRAGADLDWSRPAGTLAWSCARTADHAVDAVLAPAFFLASRKRDGYPAFGPCGPGAGSSPGVFAESLETATRVLVAVVAGTSPDVRAVIWRRPTLETRPRDDFVPRAGLELVLHGHDVCTGLGIGFRPPASSCERLRRHTGDWPHWSSPGWTPLTMAGDAWTDLLRASGRVPAAAE